MPTASRASRERPSPGPVPARLRATSRPDVCAPPDPHACVAPRRPRVPTPNVASHPDARASPTPNVASRPEARIPRIWRPHSPRRPRVPEVQRRVTPRRPRVPELQRRVAPLRPRVPELQRQVAPRPPRISRCPTSAGGAPEQRVRRARTGAPRRASSRGAALPLRRAPASARPRPGTLSRAAAARASRIWAALHTRAHAWQPNGWRYAAGTN